MKVLILRDLPGQYRRGDTPEVSDAYARNFLFPKGLAKVATAADLAAIARLEARTAADQAARHASRAAAQEKLRGTVVQLNAKANPKGRLFAAVKSSTVLQHLEQIAGTQLDGANIEPSTFKSIGVTPASIRWSDGTTIPISVEVTNG